MVGPIISEWSHYQTLSSNHDNIQIQVHVHVHVDFQSGSTGLDKYKSTYSSTSMIRVLGKYGIGTLQFSHPCLLHSLSLKTVL